MLFKKAVLIIHGFSDGMWETEYLLNFLQFNTNYDVYGFTLPGHEKAVVKSVKCDDWINASIEKMDALITKYHTVYVVGHSMGGVIASYLASHYKQVKKLVLLAPAFIYGNFDQNKLDIKEQLIEGEEYNTKHKEGIYNDLLMKLFRVPISSILEFTKLVKNNYECPKDIMCPVLILHGVDDEIIPIASSEYVYYSVKSKYKYLTLVKNIKHRILISEKKEQVSIYIKHFLRGGLKWTRTKKLEI